MLTVLLISIISMSCGSKSTKVDQLKEGDYYTCTMHPEIQEQQPGDCPKCGMKLVLKSTMPSDEMPEQIVSDSSDNHNHEGH